MPAYIQGNFCLQWAESRGVETGYYRLLIKLICFKPVLLSEDIWEQTTKSSTLQL